MEHLFELVVGRVAQAFFDVEGHRQLRVVVRPDCVVVHLHVVVDRLFVRQVVVVLLLRVTDKVVRGDVDLFFLLVLVLLPA